MSLNLPLKSYPLEENDLSQNTLISSGGIRKAKLLSWLQIGLWRGKKKYCELNISIWKDFHTLISASKPFLLHCAYFTSVRVRSHCNGLLALYLQVTKLGALVEWTEEYSYIRRVHNKVTINSSELKKYLPLNSNKSLIQCCLSHVKKHLIPHLYHNKECKKLSHMILNIMMLHIFKSIWILNKIL